jgi:hypothetical protein
VRSETSPSPAPDATNGSGPGAEIDRLRRRVDELSQQVLGARDAAVGAEAELGVARSRIVELEQRVHVLTVEVDELRVVAGRHPTRVAAAAMAGGDRLAGLARRAGRRLGS